jgi:hypothetical protein
MNCIAPALLCGRYGGGVAVSLGESFESTGLLSEACCFFLVSLLGLGAVITVPIAKVVLGVPIEEPKGCDSYADVDEPRDSGEELAEGSKDLPDEV